MARMVPAWPVGARSEAERKVFAALNRSLPDDYVVLQNPRWLETTPSRVREFEADFLIGHPVKGALVLEVKGGAVSFEPDSGAWKSVDRTGSAFPINNPYLQAQDARHSLRRTLRANPTFPGHWGPFGHAVVFPDGFVTSRPLAEGPAELTFTAEDLLDQGGLRERVDGALTFWGLPSGSDSGLTALRVLRETLANKFEVRTLRTSIDSADREFVALSEQQVRLLACLEENPRVAVAGCAGSGKTLLAVEKARRLAARGSRTLLTCYNRPLADHLEEILRGTAHLQVCDFHQLCISTASRAGLSTTRGNLDEKAYYGTVLPELLVKAIDLLKEPFDSIVVDEGQDFSGDWWDPLMLALRRPDADTFYIFYDDNQALYDRPWGLPADMFRYRLGENWRNTKSINRIIELYYDGQPVVPMGPEGITVERAHVTSQDEVRGELSRLLHRLCREEAVPCEDVVVLTPQNVTRSGLVGQVGSFMLCECPAGQNQVQVSSIHRFKGLEAKVAIIAGVRERDATAKALMYVATSRARSHLALIAYKDGASPS